MTAVTAVPRVIGPTLDQRRREHHQHDQTAGTSTPRAPRVTAQPNRNRRIVNANNAPANS